MSDKSSTRRDDAEVRALVPPNEGALRSFVQALLAKKREAGRGEHNFAPLSILYSLIPNPYSLIPNLISLKSRFRIGYFRQSL